MSPLMFFFTGILSNHPNHTIDNVTKDALKLRVYIIKSCAPATIKKYKADSKLEKGKRHVPGHPVVI